MTMPTLLGYLAGFGSFSKQSEVLCTQGLTFLLREHEDARSALANEVKARTGVWIGDSLTWKAEVVQDDKVRVDLEACTAEDIPVVKIEAKLGAELTPEQLKLHAENIGERNSGKAALLVLVPTLRTAEAAEVTARAFKLSGTGPWRATDAHPIGIAIFSWGELFSALQTGKEERFRYDLEQLQAMYRVLSGDYIAPQASDEKLGQLKTIEKTDLVSLIDQAIRRLTKYH